MQDLLQQYEYLNDHPENVKAYEIRHKKAFFLNKTEYRSMQELKEVKAAAKEGSYSSLIVTGTQASLMKGFTDEHVYEKPELSLGNLHELSALTSEPNHQLPESSPGQLVDLSVLTSERNHKIPELTPLQHSLASVTPVTSIANHFSTFINEFSKMNDESNEVGEELREISSLKR